MRTTPVVAAALLLAGACGPAQEPLPEPAPVAPSAADRRPRPAPVEAEDPTSRHGFADSPMTPLADDLVDLAVAAATGAPLPDIGIPRERTRQGAEHVSFSHGLDRLPEDVAVVGLGMELDIILRERGSGPQGARRDARLRTPLFLSRTGVRLVRVAVTNYVSPEPLPPPLSGLEPVARQILVALRTDTLEAILVGEGERDVFGNDALFEQMLDARPPEEVVERAAALAREAPEPLGYRVDDIMILLRTPEGTFYAMRMDLDHEEGGVELDDGPLVRIRPVERL